MARGHIPEGNNFAVKRHAFKYPETIVLFPAESVLCEGKGVIYKAASYRLEV
jgi:hypothetical protein